jgi:hypothetical protein
MDQHSGKYANSLRTSGGTKMPPESMLPYRSKHGISFVYEVTHLALNGLQQKRFHRHVTVNQGGQATIVHSGEEGPKDNNMPSDPLKRKR